MKPKALSKQELDKIEPRATDFVVWCPKLTGFGVRVRPSGKMSFIAMYRPEGSKTLRKVTIGAYGVWTVDMARKEAEDILRDAERGVDRAEQKAKKRLEPTLAEVCDDYLEEACGHKKPSTMATDRGSIARHIKPLLGSMKISAITQSDVRRFATSVAKGETAIDEKTKKHGRARVRGGQGASNRTLRLLSAIFSYAIGQGYIATNPRSGVKENKPDRKVKRYLKPDEFIRIGNALREAETIGLPWHLNDGKKTKHRPIGSEMKRCDPMDPFAVAAIRLLLVTGCRMSEILTLKWAHVDLDGGFLNLPDTKTGAKIVMLGAPALKILAELPHIEGNPHVIAGEGKTHRCDLKRPWMQITRHAGLDKREDQEQLRIHDMRHAFASVAATSGMGLPMVGALLGHKSTITTQRYAHLADIAQQSAADAVASKIEAALNAGPNVVPLRGAA